MEFVYKRVFNHLCLSFCLSFCIFFWLSISLQASGYGSGDDAYEDIKGGDEVKKVVEERAYTMVCTYSHSYTPHTLGSF